MYFLVVVYYFMYVFVNDEKPEAEGEGRKSGIDASDMLLDDWIQSLSNHDGSYYPVSSIFSALFVCIDS